jgi:hypothetical protein
MPVTGLVLLAATALIVGGLVVGLVTIIMLLMRISRSLADASFHLGLIPDQLDPLGPAVSRLTGSLAGYRAQATSDNTVTVHG